MAIDYLEKKQERITAEQSTVSKAKNLFKKEAYEYFKRHDYHLRRGLFLNSFFSFMEEP